MPNANHRGGDANTKLTRAVIAHYGPVCWLKLPGCTRRATTKDHVIPKAAGGTDDLGNLRPACKHCNSVRQNMAIGGVGLDVHIVIGPPTAGKTTYVAEHAGPLDVVIDLDRIARALMPETAGQIHTYPAYVRHIAIGAREAAITRALRLGEHATVWLIHAVPDPRTLALYAAMRYDIIAIDPGRLEVERRAHGTRPRGAYNAITEWYRRYPTPERIAAVTAAAAPAAPADAAQPTALLPSRPW